MIVKNLNTNELYDVDIISINLSKDQNTIYYNDNHSNFIPTNYETELIIEYKIGDGKFHKFIYDSYGSPSKFDIQINYFNILNAYLKNITINSKSIVSVTINLDHYVILDKTPEDIIIERRNETIDNVLK